MLQIDVPHGASFMQHTFNCSSPIEFWRPEIGSHDKPTFTKMARMFMKYSEHVAAQEGVDYSSPVDMGVPLHPTYGRRREKPVLVRLDRLQSFEDVTRDVFKYDMSLAKNSDDADGEVRERSRSPPIVDSDHSTHLSGYHNDTNASALIRWFKSPYFQEYYRVQGMPSLRALKNISRIARSLILNLGPEYGSAWVCEQLILSFESLMNARLSVLQACGDSSPYDSPSLPRCMASQLDTLVESLDVAGTPNTNYIRSNLSFTLKTSAVAAALVAKGRAVLLHGFKQSETAEVQLNANKRRDHQLWLDDNIHALHQRMALHVDMLMRRRNGPNYQYLRSFSEVDTSESDDITVNFMGMKMKWAPYTVDMDRRYW